MSNHPTGEHTLWELAGDDELMNERLEAASESAELVCLECDSRWTWSVGEGWAFFAETCPECNGELTTKERDADA